MPFPAFLTCIIAALGVGWLLSERGKSLIRERAKWLQEGLELQHQNYKEAASQRDRFRYFYNEQLIENEKLRQQLEVS